MSQQLLFAPASRSDDPSTSKDAEQRVTRSGARATQAEQVLALVKRYPGRTSAELAAFSGTLDRWQVARRLPDLERNQLAHRGEPKRCQVTKTGGVTWLPGPAPDNDGAPAAQAEQRAA